MRNKWLAFLLSCAVLLSCIGASLPAVMANEATYAFEIIQDFSDGSTYTRNSMWSRGVLTTVKNSETGATDGAASIFQMSQSQVSNGENTVNGTSALSMCMASTGFGWGASHLMNGNLPTATIDNMAGIFFRMKTDTAHAAALSVTTVGKNTVATGSATNTNSRPAKYLADGDKNSHNTAGNAGALLDEYSLTKDSANIRYYSTTGTLVATGRAVPAEFDGWIFIEVADWASYQKDGITINWTDSDYTYVNTYVPEIAGANNKWCLNNGTMTSVVLDDLGYYAAGTKNADYAAIIQSIAEGNTTGSSADGDKDNTSAYAFEIFQNFSDGSTYTRNSMWSRGVLTTVKCPLTGATDGAATIFQMSEAQVNNGQNMVNGTPALALRTNSAGYGWGASHLMNGALPTATIDNMAGIFFRMKTDTKHATALSVTTVGKNTVATGSATTTGSNPAKYLADGDKNSHNTVGNAGALLDEYSLTKNSTNIRYYSIAGTLVSTGRVVPAGFDGYVFIEVKNWDSYTKDGITINWIDSDYTYVNTYVPEIAGANNKWCLNDGTFTSVVIDDLGYYAAGSKVNADYAAIIESIAEGNATGSGTTGGEEKDPNAYAFHIFQNFSDASTYTRNSMWSRGVLTAVKSPLEGSTDGAATIFQMSEAQVNGGEHMLNGTPALAMRMTSQGCGWGASHLMNGALPTAAIDDLSGIFFRMKTDTAHKTALSVTTVGKNTVATGSATATGSNPANYLADGDKNDHNTVGNAGALLDEYSLTKKSTNIRYYSTTGELVSTGRAVPAGFDGYVFIEVKNWDSYTKDGITINWIDSDYDYVTSFVPEIGGTNNKWCVNGTMTSVVIDDLGYYAAGKADSAYASIIQSIADGKTTGSSSENNPGGGEGGGEGGGDDTPVYTYSVIQNYESATDRANSGRALLKGGSSEFGTVTTPSTYAPNPAPAALNGTASFYSVLTGDWGVDHLVADLAAAPDSGITGLFLRMRYDLTEKMADKKLALSINTTGASTTESQTRDEVTKDVPISGLNKAGYDLTASNAGIRYYNADGTVNTEASGNLMPAAFDGYIFIPVANVAAYTWDGISIAYAPDWAVTGATGHWQVDGKVVGFDDIGFYTMAAGAVDSDYAALISEVAGTPGSGEGGGDGPADDHVPQSAFDILQNYESQADRDNSDRVLLKDGSSAFGTVTKPTTREPDVPILPLNGNYSFASVLSDSWGAEHLVSVLPNEPASYVSGVFLRLCYNLSEKMAGKKLVLSVNTTGRTTAESQERDGVIKNVPISGLNKAEYDLTMNNTGIRYYNIDGTVNTEGSGNLMPAAFDGYIFIPVADVSAYTWHGITFVYAPGWAATGGSAHWQIPDAVVRFDDIGFYEVIDPENDAEYAAFINAIRAGNTGTDLTGKPTQQGPGSGIVDPGNGDDSGGGTEADGTFQYQMVNTYESASEQDVVGLHYCGETLLTQVNALSGTNSMFTSVIANDWAMYTLENEPPAPEIDNATGFFFRLKVDHTNNEAGEGSRQICASTGAEELGDVEWAGDYGHFWGVEHGEIVCVWLNGKVQRGTKIPHNFDGYVFLRDGRSTMNERYEDGFLKSLRVVFPAWGAWEDVPLKWKGSDLIFDNVGYYSVSDTQSNKVYRELAAQLVKDFAANELPEDFIPEMNTYMSYENEGVPADSGTAGYYIRPYLYYHTEMPIAVKWSVVEGKATIEPLDDPDDATKNKHGAKIIFGTAGTVVIRCALRDDPNQYADYTFTVAKNRSKLDAAVFDATLLASMAQGEWKVVLEEAVEAARLVLMDTSLTQESYEAYITFLMGLMTAFENGEDIPVDVIGDAPAVPSVPNEPGTPSEPSEPDIPGEPGEPEEPETPEAPSGSSPQTGETGFLYWALALAAVALGMVCILRKKAGAK